MYSVNNTPTKRRNETATDSQSVSTRNARQLNEQEQKVRLWIRGQHGILSKVAREFELSVQFIQRIAYNREAQSKDYRVERRLLQLGCPLIQHVPQLKPSKAK